MTTPNKNDANFANFVAIEADIRSGRHRQAAQALDALRATSPLDVRIYLAGAMLAQAVGNPKREIASLRHALSLVPGEANLHAELAKALSREGRHDEAVVAANAAVELAPRDLPTLEVAVAIANAAGDFALAQRLLHAALAIKPGDIAIRRAIGICLTKLHLYAQAAAHWRATLAETPDDPSALGFLGMSLIELGENDEAAAVLARAFALAPDNTSLQFHLAIARGETPRTQPREMMQELFDGYAGRFDKHLVGQLKYRVPKRVAEIIRARSAMRDTSVLDLGCGTGLLGVYLGKIRGAFVGVDISPKMIEQATRHGVYTKFLCGDLLEELQRVAPGSFDYVVANDVFIYVGDLTDVIPAAFAALGHRGALIFSCETANAAEGDLVLRPSKRYAHSIVSVQTLCRQAGFIDLVVESIDLRLDVDQPIPGFIAIAQKL